MTNIITSKALSRAAQALGIVTIVGLGSIATASDADAGGKKRHWHKHHWGGVYFNYYPDHYYYPAYHYGKRKCHFHKWKGKRRHFHRHVKCHYHGWHRGIRRVR